MPENLWKFSLAALPKYQQATDVAQSIQSKKDLLFKGTSEVKIIDDEKEDNSKEAQAFFKLLGGTADDCNPAGDPGEDLVRPK